MTQKPETAPETPRDSGGRRPKNDLVVNRLHAIQRVQEVESLAGASRWATWLLVALLSCAVVWFLIQSIAMNLVVEHDVILTKEQIDQGARIEVPPAPSPFVDVIDYFHALMAGEITPLVILHPLSVIIVLVILLIIVMLMERGTTKRGGRSLTVDAPEARQHQARYFSNPLSRGSADDLADLSGEAAFGDDMPRTLRTLLSWWNKTEPPDRSALENGLQELRRYLGDAGYLWFSCCATLPRPHWHLAMYLGRAMRTERGKMVYSFENADKLGSLPWMVSDNIPNWLRKTLLAGLNKHHQQQLRRVMQCLLISTSQKCKADMALELCGKHASFMRQHGNDLSARILQNATEDSELKDPLFQEFMLRGVDDEYYEENLDMPTRVISTDNFQGRISLAALWVSRIAWGVGVLTLAGIVLFLVFLKDFGGFKLSVSPPIGLIRVGDEKQNPPATFFWKSEGDHMITVTSKDYVTHHLMLDVEGRVMADLSPFPLTHFRSGRLRPLPDGSRGNPEVDPEDAREFPIQAREAILEQAAPEEGEEQHEAETEEASPAAGDGASFEQPMVPSEGATPQSVDPGGAAMETVSQVSAPTPPAGKQLGASPDRPQLLPNSEPRAGPEREPPQDGASPASPLPNPGRQATESRSEFPAEHAGHSERLSSAQAAAAEEGEDATASDPASELDLTALWEGFSAVGPARPLELVEPQAQPRPQPRAAETPSGTAATTNWQPSGQYRVLRRNRGVGLAVPRGSHPISIYGVEDGLVIEIEEQFLKQLRGLRDFHLARKAQSAPTPPEEESAPAPAP